MDGLLGISRCYSKILDEALVVHYTSTVQEVFTKCVRFELMECKNLEFLSRVQSSEYKLIPNLPSWVADLTARKVSLISCKGGFFLA